MCQIFALVQSLFSAPTMEKGAYSGSEHFLSYDGTWSNKAIKAKLPLLSLGARAIRKQLQPCGDV